jgi:hypothetical protein
MKKIFFSMLVFYILAFTQGCASSNGRVGVYVTGDIDQKENKVLNSRILEIFVNSGKYEAVERSDAFLAEIDKEQKKQRSGAVDDRQISELGKQFGVQFVCVADVVEVYDVKHISARLIDVETAVIVAVGNTESPLNNLEALKDVSNKIVSPMLKVSTSSKKKAKNMESITNKTEDKPETKVEDKAKDKVETKVENKAKDKVEIKTENKIENRYNDDYNQYRRQSIYDNYYDD